ncbi:Glutamyl aminopeptidase [Aphelenchoides bicaudatus]|nr:Glutamyl aminopeptidase [Aphelenchoides bicaudatus]
MSILRSDHKHHNGISYVRATCLPADELEPCLRGVIHQQHEHPEVALNQALAHSTHVHSNMVRFSKSKQGQSFSQHRPKKKQCMSRCILCLLIQSVFIFGVFLAFLIGHWASEVEFGNDTFLLSAFNNHINNRVDDESQLFRLNLTTSSTTNLTSSPELKVEFEEENDDAEKFQYTRLPPFAPPNLTLQDVYAPDSELSTKQHWIHKLGQVYAEEQINLLPTNLKPVHYELELDFTEFASTEYIYGHAKIMVESFGNLTTDEIVFHAASNIFIERLRLEQNGRIVVVSNVKRDLNRDLVRMFVNENLTAGWYRIFAEFRTRICQSEHEGAQCITQMVYGKDGSKTKQKIVGFTTKFEPGFAKTFLPCWDEPRFRTTFNITVKHPQDTFVLSNTIALSTDKKLRPDHSITRFKESPQMPIYLLSFALANLNQLELRTTRNMPLSIWTTQDNALASHFAGHFAPVIFDRVEKDFEVTYPLDKLDIVLTPNYPVDGMEQWGLIVFRDISVLLPSAFEGQNMTVDRISEQYKVEKIIAHEVIHQWFGNFISFYDWTDVWLSEGFTSYFVYDFLNTDHPHLTDNEYYLQLIDLLKRQTSNYKTALIHPLKQNRDFDELFDRSNLYIKGAVIVKMIKDLLGVEKFQKGITRFLSDNAYKAVGRESLWQALPTFVDHGAEEERLSTVMEGWLLNEGMPEVIISRNYEDQTIRITQRACNQNSYVIYLTDTWNSTYIEQPRKRRSKPERNFDEFIEPEHKPRLNRQRKNRHKNKFGVYQRNQVENRIQLFRGEKFPKADSSKSMRPTEIHQQPSPKRRRNPGGPNLWSIPFGYSFGSVRSSSGQTVRQFWLHNETIRFVDLGVQSYQYILANPHFIYPYKVNYDIDNWKLLIDQLHRDHNEIPVMSRMQLIVDANTYLKQSGIPQLYVQLLGYLAKEEDLGVLLVGLDSLHDLVQMVSGTSLVGPLMIHFIQVIQQFDRQLELTASNAELAAVWLLSPTRLTKLYQLRCVANLVTCDQNKQVQQWMSFPNSLDADHHQQITAICHFLFTQAGPAELAILMGLLKQPISSANSHQWSVNIQLATCVRDEDLIEGIVDQIVKTKNAGVYLSVLENSYSVQYNRKFREIFWRGIGRLSLHERHMLFAVNTGKPDKIARLLLHSVKTFEELDLVTSLLDTWPAHLKIHLESIRRKLEWLQKAAISQIHKFLIEEVD